MPAFFDYPEEIIREAERAGYRTMFVDDRPSERIPVKALLRVNRNLLKHARRRYFQKVLEKTKGISFDKVLVISGQSLCFDPGMIGELRSTQKNAEFILYLWDSIANYPSIREIFGFFDRIWSFDPEDAASEQIAFLPLFYTEGYAALRRHAPNPGTACFVGTAHPGKYSSVLAMSEALRPYCPTQRIRMYLPSRLLWLWRKCTSREFRKTRPSDFTFRKLTGSQTQALTGASSIILDSPQNHQHGLTIRCIEAMGAGRKLITANPGIRNYDFYTPANILIWNPEWTKDLTRRKDSARSPEDSGVPGTEQEMAQQLRDFVSTPAVPTDDHLLEAYSLRTWLHTVLEGRPPGTGHEHTAKENQHTV